MITVVEIVIGIRFSIGKLHVVCLSLLSDGGQCTSPFSFPTDSDCPVSITLAIVVGVPFLVLIIIIIQDTNHQHHLRHQSKKVPIGSYSIKSSPREVSTGKVLFLVLQFNWAHICDSINLLLHYTPTTTGKTCNCTLAFLRMHFTLLSIVSALQLQLTRPFTHNC